MPSATHLLIAAFSIVAATIIQGATGCLPVDTYVKDAYDALKYKEQHYRAISHGCFLKRADNALEGTTGSVTEIEKLTWRKCFDHCIGDKETPKDTDMLGLEKNNCWCRFRFPDEDQVLESRCKIKCEGDDEEMCGDEGLISVYSAKMSTKG